MRSVVDDPLCVGKVVHKVTEQLTFEESWIEYHRQLEMQKPPKQQIQTADVVMFTGTQGVVMINGKDHPKRLEKGTLGFVNGARSGVYNTHITTRRMSLWVCSLDLKPMKVSEF